MTRRHAVAAFALLGILGPSDVAVAGGRARAGGTIAIALPQAPVSDGVPSTPVDAAVAALTHTPLCRLVDAAPQPNGAVRLTPLGPPVTAAQLAEGILRVKRDKGPYGALARAVRGATVAGDAVELIADLPWVELSDVLCHPAFALPVGPFVHEGGGKYAANAQFPRGRPFVDRLVVQVLEPRAAQRAFAQDRVQLSWGGGTDDPAPARFATVLAVPAELATELRAAIDSTVDRQDLIRFFVRGPATPLSELLPGPTRAPPIKPSPRKPALELTLSFDARSADHRAVAERLQVKLQPLGFAVRLSPTSAPLLEPRPGELRLFSVGVPTSGTVATEFFRALGGAAASTPVAALPVIPLYVEGLGAQQSKRLVRAPRDGWGLPRVDELWFLGDDG